MKQESRRVKMTKKMLCESLMYFLSQKHISHITIKEICDYADINRSTYYRYYQDPMDQLYKIQDDIIEELDLYVRKLEKNINHSSQASFVDYEASMKEYLECVQEKKKAIQILMKALPDNEFIIKFVEHIRNNLVILSLNSNGTTRFYDYVFASSGCIGLLVHWLTVEPEMGIEAVAQLMVTYTNIFIQEEPNTQIP